MSINSSVFVCLAVGLLIAAQGNVAVTAQDEWKEAFEPKQLKTDEGVLNYRLFDPTGAESAGEGGKKFPLVLFLHGAGERGDDNLAQLKHGVVEFHRRQDEQPCFVLVPQCPESKRWVERNWDESSGQGTFAEEPSVTMRSVLRVVEDLLKSGHVDPARVYVTGLSMGGYGTWYAAGYKESPFVAAAPICGGGDPEWAKRYVGMPLWVFHGDDDQAVPVERSREMVEAIRQAGGDPKYTEYAGVGHDSWTRTYADDAFHQWLFSQGR